MTTVMAFGTFDLLHPGHEYFLRQAKKQGDYLIVIIARDLTVKKVKGKLPQANEKQRQQAVLSLNLADKAVLGSLTDKYAAIKKYQPDIIALGYDQTHFVRGLKEQIKKLKLNAKIIRLKPFKTDQYKSSILKMENDLTKIFDFLKLAGNLKKTFRYKMADKKLKESVADHTWRLALMSFIVADELKLEIDIPRAVEIALAHDLAEAITGDIGALLIYNKTVSPKKKQELEEAAMKKLAAKIPKKAAKKIIELWREYNYGSTAEAKYIYALDKLEALTHLSEAGYKTYNDLDFIPIYADKAVRGFPGLKPALKILKDKLKEEYKKGEFEWKNKYDKV
ncbi:MAG: HD domain-containing protein [Patescibacteria group bacterium]|nr:HD domain-containing protein [Patescibacteria group bacterium]